MKPARWILLIALLFLFAISIALPSRGQSFTRLAWDQTSPDLISAQNMTYKFYRDGSPTGVVFTGVACTASVSTSPVGTYPCSVTFPTSTAGVQHSINVTAGNAAGESPKSLPYTYTLIMIPIAPLNVRSLD